MLHSAPVVKQPKGLRRKKSKKPDLAVKDEFRRFKCRDTCSALQNRSWEGTLSDLLDTGKIKKKRKELFRTAEQGLHVGIMK